MFISPPIPYNILTVDNTGTIDVTSAINSALAQGGMWVARTGTYKISSPLAMAVAGTKLWCAGYQSTIFQPTSAFSGSNIFNITADYCELHNLQMSYASTTTLTNPSADGIQITGAQDVLIENVRAYYLNGWCLQSTGGSANPNYNAVLRNIRNYQCLQGFHLLGIAGSAYGGLHRVSDCYANQTQGGDCWFIEDFLDLEAVNIFGEVATGKNGRAFHIKGNCNAIFVSNFDLGLYPYGSLQDNILIESGSNGSPAHIGFSNGITEGGTAGLTISAGSQIIFDNTNFYSNQTYGVNITGGSQIRIKDSFFDHNGSVAGGTRYEIQSSGSADIVVENNTFATPHGTGVNQVDHVINDTAFTMKLKNNSIIGTGFAGNNGNTINNYPQWVENNVGINYTVGNIGVSLPSTGVATATQAFAYTAYVSGGTVTQIAVGGNNTGLTSGSFRVPIGQTLTVTYSSTPNWLTIGD